ncbi:hypothetical protein CEXT_687411, partial [Caerostris extrusa]
LQTVELVANFDSAAQVGSFPDFPVTRPYLNKTRAHPLIDEIINHNLLLRFSASVHVSTSPISSHTDIPVDISETRGTTPRKASSSSHPAPNPPAKDTSAWPRRTQ